MRVYALLIIGSLLNVTVINSAWSKSDNHNDCERLHVQIGNLTSTNCALTSYKVVHGNLRSAPPTSIPPGFTGDFDIIQSFHGPNVILDYNCNGEHITFASQQNYCFMSAGKITGTIIDATAKIQATLSKETGSYFWSKPGFINWVIS